MQCIRSAHPFALLFLSATWSLVHPAVAQEVRPLELGSRASADQVSVSRVFEGSVLDPHGAPAVGAVVVTSAGGKAVVDEHGNFRLEVEVALEAESVQVTAVGAAGRSLVTSTRVGLAATSGPVRTGVLRLSAGSTCSPGWLPTFGVVPGTNSRVHALMVFDDGNGPALFAGGDFTIAGNASAIRMARWDGASWTAVGSGMDGSVKALAAFDDGSGPALYAGGSFTTAGGAAASNIARWNGTSWTALGSGIAGSSAVVESLAVFDDGNGPALFAGGYFTSAGGVTTSGIARWDGSSWSAVSGGTSSGAHVSALTVFDEGNGPALFAGGGFTLAGGVAVNNIARWNGSAWTALGSGLTGLGANVRALTVFDQGQGPALYAGGEFTVAGGVSAKRIARWNGTSWAPLGTGIAGTVLTLAGYDAGNGPELYAGGAFIGVLGVAGSSFVARWNGTSWASLATGMPEQVYALATFDGGSGTKLFVGGASGLWNFIAAWDGSAWKPVGTGLSGIIYAQAVFDDGSGPALHVAGSFLCAGGEVIQNIAKWTGSSWASIGGTIGNVRTLLVFDDGGGPALYAGGQFTSAGGVAASRVAKWDGTSWTPLGSGIGQVLVNSLAIHDDGSGPALYAGGGFHMAEGQVVENVAKWDGSSWTPLGFGTNGPVNALASYDDGSGPALYAGGLFDLADGFTAFFIARWNGSNWSPVGSGLDGSGAINDMTVFDDGSGPALYVGGRITTAGGVPASHIARWNGSWSAVGSGLSSFVDVLEVLDDGSGPALYAGGSFTSAGGEAANHIARWNGTSWSALGSGMSDNVLSLASFDDGSGPALFAGGDYLTALDSGDSYLAQWGCDTTPPTLDCPAVYARLAFGATGTVVEFTVEATDDHDPSPVVVCTPPSGSFFPRGTTPVTCTATDASGNQSMCTFPVVVQSKVWRGTQKF